jgi:hypothetical protein
MNVVITQFSDCESIKAHLAERFSDAAHCELAAILLFIDSARERIDGLQGVAASLHLQKKFAIEGTSVNVTAKTVHGMLPRLIARLRA